jgi:putative ABC transport system ATP-binding protein
VTADGDAGIRLTDLWRTYVVGGREVHALAGVTEEVRAGEHVAVMGPSGSGKSTLLNVIGLLDRPTKGSYVLGGRETAGLDEAELARLRREAIGYVFQSFHLVPRLDARANVELPLVLAGTPRGDRRARSAEALERVGLGDRLDHKPSELSGGERQRVAIARATILRPAVLLADEPTGNLDRASGEAVLELLEELQRGGLTLIVVTHDVDVARRAQRVLMLDDGRVARRMDAPGPEDLAAALAHLRAD